MDKTGGVSCEGEIRSAACVALALTAVWQTHWHHSVEEMHGGRKRWRSEEKSEGSKAPDTLTQKKSVKLRLKVK